VLHSPPRESGLDLAPVLNDGGLDVRGSEVHMGSVGSVGGFERF